MKPSVTVLIPAYNEAQRIAQTVESARSIAAVDQVVVVDDGSSDGTRNRAIEAGAFVVALERNMGKAGAVQAGLRYVEGEVVLLLDADLERTAQLGERLLEPIVTGQADLAVAAFPKEGGKSGFGIVENLARTAVRYFGGITTRSPLSGQRAVRKEALQSLPDIGSGFGLEVAMTVQALRSGYRVVEVEVPFTHAKTGRDLPGFKHRIKQLLHITWVVAKLAVKGRTASPASNQNRTATEEPAADSAKEEQPTCS